MKAVSKILTLVSITLILSACVQVTPEVKKSSNQLAISSVRDLPNTYPKDSLFNLSPKYVKETSLKAEQTQAIYQLYTNAISQDLELNGYKVAQTSQQAAFHIGFGIALSDDFTDDNINEKFGVSPGLPDQAGLKKGSFLVYVEDAATGQRVWRGIAQGFAHEELSTQERELRTQVIVASVMKQFYQTN